VHICFSPFTITNPWYTKPSSHPSQHIGSTLVAASALCSSFSLQYKQQNVPVGQVDEAGVRIHCPVSDDGSASSSKPPRLNIG
jgi:hypothetical protein